MNRVKPSPAPTRRGDGKRLIANNRRARHEYLIEETFEAGMVLTGTEIKSVRAGKVNLQDAYARIENGEAWLYNMHISPYEQGNRMNVDPMRPRKLLLKRPELNRLFGKVQTSGLTLVPLSIYIRNGFAKLDLALARGKKLYDKRQALAEREAQREVEREVRGRGSYSHGGDE
jgi:SsrA-binding protein